MIKIYVEQDGIGSITGYPVSERWAKRFARTAKINGGPSHTTFYFQGDAAEEFITEHVPPCHHSSIRKGFGVIFMIDPWIVGHFYGYDAHTAASPQ